MSKNLILSFAPGARGFLLSKWLYINQIVNFWAAPKSTVLNFDSNNHSLMPLYSDVLFRWKDEKTQRLFNDIENCLTQQEADCNYIQSLIAQSTNAICVGPNKNPYNLILSHHGSAQGLSTLSKCLTARVIRITLNDSTQAKECYVRKFNEDPDPAYLSRYYGLYLNDYDFCINVKLDMVMNLDLDFLKEELK